MMFKKTLLVAFAGSVLLLTGCTHTPKDRQADGVIAGEAGNGDAAGDASARSYAMNGGDAFNGQNRMGAEGDNSQMAGNDLTVYFPFDSNKIEPKYNQPLIAESNYLLGHPGAHIRLAGNTDTRGSREYNIALGWRRAQAVAQFLEQHGVNGKQLALVSYGKERPAVYGSTEADFALNRRTNLVFEAR